MLDYREKNLWEDCQTLLSDKLMTQNKITPINKNFPVTNKEKVAETLNAFFTEIVVNLKVH